MGRPWLVAGTGFICLTIVGLIVAFWTLTIIEAVNPRPFFSTVVPMLIIFPQFPLLIYIVAWCIIWGRSARVSGGAVHFLLMVLCITTTFVWTVNFFRD